MATLKEKVLNLVTKIKEVWAENGDLKAENADLKQQLAIALSDDAADDEAIIEAQTAASIAKVELAEYRSKVDAIVVEHEELIAVLDGADLAAEPAPVEEVVPPHPDIAEKRNYLAEVPSSSPVTPVPDLLADGGDAPL